MRARINIRDWRENLFKILYYEFEYPALLVPLALLGTG
jgi:hypothetical protein